MRRAARNTLIVFLFLLVLPVPGLNGQTAQLQPQSSSSPPAAEPSDVASPDAILAAVYEVISGPAGKARDWNRFRSLFAPGARLIPIVSSPKGSIHAQSMTPDEYATRGAPYFEKNGFYEREIARRTERWGMIVQAFSTYESRHSRSDSTPFERGINSFQLFFDGSRWWIVTIMWQGETPSNPLTPEFLPPPGE
jgi:hypothetical protein